MDAQGEKLWKAQGTGVMISYRRGPGTGIALQKVIERDMSVIETSLQS